MCRFVEPARQPDYSNERTGHGRAAHCAQPCPRDRKRWRPANNRVLRGVSGNLGTADGVHARCVAVVQFPGSGCEPDRRLLAAEYGTAERAQPPSVFTYTTLSDLVVCRWSTILTAGASAP